MYDIFFRHHTYKKVDGQVELTEVGPRFEMKGKLHIVICKIFVSSWWGKVKSEGEPNGPCLCVF